MSAKLIKNNRLATLWYSLLFILIFLPSLTIAADQQATVDLHVSTGARASTDGDYHADHHADHHAAHHAALPTGDANSAQTQRELSEPANTDHVRARKQRFIKKELTHQNFHSKYYSASDGYRSPVYGEQSDAYIAYRSSHNRSALTGTASSLAAYSLTSGSASLLARSKLAGHTTSSASIQGPVFQQELPARVSFSNNSGLVLNCAATGNPTPQVSWQTETGISVLSPSQSIDSLNLLNLNTPLVHQNPSTNALVFRSFAADEFSPEVHSTKYRCLASNLHGTITSPLVQVKAGRSFCSFYSLANCQSVVRLFSSDDQHNRQWSADRSKCSDHSEFARVPFTNLFGRRATYAESCMVYDWPLMTTYLHNVESTLP